MDNKTQEINKDDIWIANWYSFYLKENEIWNILDSIEKTMNEDITENHEIPELTNQEREQLTNEIITNKEKIITSWLKKKEMLDFYKKYNISKSEVIDSLGYFWSEKIIKYIIDDLNWEINTDSKHIYITTRFLAFIKIKNLLIEDLLNIIIVLKNCLIEHIEELDLKKINQLNHIFDKISTNLSKNFNDIIINLLKEYTNAIDCSNIISKTDIKWNIIDVNDEFCRLSWYTKEEMLWKPHNIVRHPDMSSELFKELWDTIQNKKVWKWIIKNRKKDWSSYWAKSTIVPILDENWQIIEYISIRTDITELKEAHKNLWEYTNVLNETNIVLKLDAEWKIITVNDTFLKISWYQSENLLWKFYINDLVITNNEESLISNIPIIKKEEIKDIQRYINKWKTWKWIIENKGKIWNRFWTSTSIIPILWINEEIKEFVIVQSDVTDLEIAQQKLKLSLDKQKELDHKKDQFLNIASHELRTPMTSIKWYISMILDWDAWDINEEVKMYLNQVYKSSQRLLDLINDMLDVSKIESWNQKFEIENININVLINETCKEIKTLFEKKRQSFIIDIDYDEFFYETDSNKLKQVMLNLLWNANKFTPDWWVVKLISRKEENRLIISVIDSWIWIEKAYFWKIFEKFWQVKNSLTRDINWTWLWLPIAKAIIEQMKWYLEVDSEVGRWSTFTINLPIKK